jgi:hypothetical protein
MLKILIITVEKYKEIEEIKQIRVNSGYNIMNILQTYDKNWKRKYTNNAGSTQSNIQKHMDIKKVAHGVNNTKHLIK